MAKCDDGDKVTDASRDLKALKFRDECRKKASKKGKRIRKLITKVKKLVIRLHREEKEMQYLSKCLFCPMDVGKTREERLFVIERCCDRHSYINTLSFVLGGFELLVVDHPLLLNTFLNFKSELAELRKSSPPESQVPDAKGKGSDRPAMYG